MSHIDYETLLAFAAGEIEGDLASEIEAHLATDSQAAATVTRYRAMRSMVSASDPVTPAEALVAQAKAIFHRRTAAATGGAPWWQRVEAVIAALVFDSRPQPALAGLRGSPAGFQLAFEGEAATIDLQVEPASPDEPEAWRLMGQIDSDAPDRSADVAIVPAGGRIAAVETTADRQGVFSVQVPPGRYDVHVRAGRGSVVCRNIELN